MNKGEKLNIILKTLFIAALIFTTSTLLIYFNTDKIFVDEAKKDISSYSEEDSSKLEVKSKK